GAGDRRADLYLRQERRRRVDLGVQGAGGAAVRQGQEADRQALCGPTWEALAGGKVVGAAKASAPAPEAGSIPWLLLDIKSSEGSGVFNQAKGVLRVSTHGGVAPTQGCDEAHNGQESRVPYTATYIFLK